MALVNESEEKGGTCVITKYKPDSLPFWSLCLQSWKPCVRMNLLSAWAPESPGQTRPQTSICQTRGGMKRRYEGCTFLQNNLTILTDASENPTSMLLEESM